MANRDSPEEKPMLAGTRLLVAEDDPLILMDLEHILEDAGAHIIGSCQTVQAALRVSDTEIFSAAILDIRLGRETIAPVAKELARRGIPFIFYSGQTESDPIHSEWPEHRIVPKPSAPQTIVEALADLIKH